MSDPSEQIPFCIDPALLDLRSQPQTTAPVAPGQPIESVVAAEQLVPAWADPVDTHLPVDLSGPPSTPSLNIPEPETPSNLRWKPLLQAPSSSSTLAVPSTLQFPGEQPAASGCRCTTAATMQKPMRHWRYSCPFNPSRESNPCELCGREVGRIDNLARHMADFHKDEAGPSR